MDLRPEDVARHTASYWRMILASALIFSSAAFVLALVAPISYTASATILIRPTQLIETRHKDVATSPLEHERNINSLAVALRGDDMIREAVRAVGAGKIYAEPDDLTVSERFWMLRRSLNEDDKHHTSPRFRASSNVEYKVVRAVARALHVSVEPKTNLIFVSFNHPDPEIAAQFVNALIAAARKKMSDQNIRDDGALFLTEQKKRYDKRYEASLARLAKFSEDNSMYGVDEQRKMMLEREGTALAAIQQTSNAIADKKKQSAEIARLLETFFPIAKYPQMAELLRSVGVNNATRSAGPVRPRADLEDTRAPLLLIKVYQDATQSLVKLQYEVAGLGALSEQQTRDIVAIRQELNAFAHKTATFELLQMEAQQVRQAAEQYGLLATREQVTADVSRHGLSPIVEVSQPALPPQEPSFPKPLLMVAFGFIAGLGVGIGVAFVRLRTSRAEPAENNRRGASRFDLRRTHFEALGNQPKAASRG